MRAIGRRLLSAVLLAGLLTTLPFAYSQQGGRQHKGKGKKGKGGGGSKRGGNKKAPTKKGGGS
jgi:hypothetical protein